jgi:hypothetical protein
VVSCPECGSSDYSKTVAESLAPAYFCRSCSHVWVGDYAEDVARDVIDMLSGGTKTVCTICDHEWTEGHNCALGLRTKIDMLFEKLGQIEERIDKNNCADAPDAG